MSKYDAELLVRIKRGDAIHVIRNWFLQAIHDANLSRDELTPLEQMFFEQTTIAFRAWQHQQTETVQSGSTPPKTAPPKRMATTKAQRKLVKQIEAELISRIQQREPLADTQLWFTQQLIELKLDGEQLTPFGQACFNQIVFAKEAAQREADEQAARRRPH